MKGRYSTVELSPTQRVVQQSVSSCCCVCWMSEELLSCVTLVYPPHPPPSAQSVVTPVLLHHAACSVLSCRAGLLVMLSLGFSSRRSTLLVDRPFPRCSC